MNKYSLVREFLIFSQDFISNGFVLMGSVIAVSNLKKSIKMVVNNNNK